MLTELCACFAGVEFQETGLVETGNRVKNPRCPLSPESGQVCGDVLHGPSIIIDGTEVERGCKLGFSGQHGRIDCLLEEMRIKLSVVVTDLFGASGLRILHALAQDETDPNNLALLGDDRLKCSAEQLIEKLTGRSHPVHRKMLGLQLERLRHMNE